MLRRFINYLPANNRAEAATPAHRPIRPIESNHLWTRLCRHSPSQPYDMKELILKTGRRHGFL